MTNLAKRIRLAATPMPTAAEFDAHPRCPLTGVPETVALGFEPWDGRREGAVEAAEAAATKAAEGLPPTGW